MDHEILQKILEKLDIMDKRSEEMNKRFETMDKRFDSLEQDVATIKWDVSVLKENSPLIKRAIFETRDIAEANQSDIRELKEAMKSTNENEIRLEQMQKDQQLIIEALSARSLKQESELKRIK